MSDDRFLIIPDAVRREMESLDATQREVLERAFQAAPGAEDYVPFTVLDQEEVGMRVAGHARGHISVPVELIPPPAPRGHYTPPAPPPADMPVDLDKWRSMDRATRRALLRHHRKVTG